MYALKHAMRLMLYEDYRYARALIYGETCMFWAKTKRFIDYGQTSRELEDVK